MKSATRKEVIKSLRDVANLLSAGIVKYPPKMVSQIMELVEHELGSGSLWFMNKYLPPLEAELAAFYPEEGTKAPPPKISPAMNKLARKVLEDVNDVAEVFPSPLNESQESLARSFMKGMRGSFGYGTYFEISGFNPRETSSIISRVLRKKKIEDMDDEELKAYMAALYVGSSSRRYRYSNGARKALITLVGYKENLKKVEERSAGAALSPSEERKAKELEEKVKKFRELKDYLESKGIKKSKFKPGPKRAVDHIIKVDLTGIPEKYPRDAVEAGLYDQITLTIMPARASFNGSWNSDSKKLEIVLGSFPLTKSAFEGVVRSTESTVKHELEHMVQYIMKDSLMLREQAKVGSGPLRKRGPWQEAGTPYKTGKGVDTMSTDRYVQLSQTYPSASKEELYYLNPIEFFPQTGSAVNRLLSRLRYSPWGEPMPEEEIRKNIRDIWRAHSGAGPLPVHNIYDVDPFFDALKTHNRKMWKRAVSEGWKRLLGRL